MARTKSPTSVSRRGTVHGDADRTVVWVRGEHDIATKVPLVVAIARAAQLDDVDVLVDLSGVMFMDASTIGALVGSANRLRLRSQTLAVRDPSPSASFLLDLCGLTHLVVPDRVSVVHPVGVAAALSTWVDVPPSSTSELGQRGDRREVATTARRETRRPARSMLATSDTVKDAADS